MRRPILLALVAMLISGCSSVFVNCDYDTAIDFGELKTFAWQYDQQPETGDPKLDNDLNDERIRRAINVNLSAQGFQATDRVLADFFVVYFIDHQRKLNSGLMSVGFGRGGYGRYGGVGYNAGVLEYEQTLLTIDIINPVDEKTIWRGVGTCAAYTGSNPEKYTKYTNELVAQVLKKFPPRRR